MSELPHVMRDIVQPLVLAGQDTSYLKPKFLRRGRYVERWVTEIAQGRDVPAEWWGRGSGDADRDDYIEHEECRPYIDGGRKFLAEYRFNLLHAQYEVVSTAYDYQGHVDWIGKFLQVGDKWVTDLKCGKPAPPDSPLDWAYRFQLALYVIALAEMEGRSTQEYRRADLHLFDGTYRHVERKGVADIRSARIMLDWFAESRKWSKAA